MELNTEYLSELATGSSKSKRFSKKISKFIIILLVFVVILGVGGYFYMNYNSQKTEAVGGKLTEKQIKDLVDEIGAKMELPKDEKPTIATVTDITKLSDQPFFKNAKNGDKVIIYGTTQNAILYRVSAHKIINVAQINLNNQKQTTSEQVAGATVSKSVSPSISPKTSLKVSIVPTKKVQ